MKWGTPATYAWLYSISGQQYKNQLKSWLQLDGPPGLWALVEKELARETKGKSSRSVHTDSPTLDAGDA